MNDTNQGNNRPIGKWISVLHRQFQVYLNNELKAYGLNSSQYIFLIQLYKTNNVSQETLANTLFIDKSATTRALIHLEDNGFIERIPNPCDKRSNLVRLTEKGASLKEDLFYLLVKWNNKLTARLSAEEYDAVYSLLQKMAEEIVIK